MDVVPPSTVHLGPEGEGETMVVRGSRGVSHAAVNVRVDRTAEPPVVRFNAATRHDASHSYTVAFDRNGPGDEKDRISAAIAAVIEARLASMPS